ncbi:MAG: hypothetical protein SFU98_01120 [Leptospiraceae bacterium]|nr:hypothetical protein [Leptospiraceae bacterium]
MIYLRLIFLFLAFTQLNSTPLIFSKFDLDDGKRFKSCEIQSNNRIKTWNTKRSILEKEATELAEKLAKERYWQIDCVYRLNLTDEEKNLLDRILNRMREREIEILEYNNRFFYQLVKKNLLYPGEENLISEFHKGKFDLYEILFKRTKEKIFSKSGREEYTEKDFNTIYTSILFLHIEFYFSLNEEARKRIFSKLP